jgi:hypothetical protein
LTAADGEEPGHIGFLIIKKGWSRRRLSRGP